MRGPAQPLRTVPLGITQLAVLKNNYPLYWIVCYSIDTRSYQC